MFLCRKLFMLNSDEHENLTAQGDRPNKEMESFSTDKLPKSIFTANTL